METPARTVSRLVAALEALVEQESVQIAARDYAAVFRTQQRVAPLVERLGQMGSAAADEDSRSRMACLVVKRRASQAHIAARISSLREELASVGRRRAGLRRLAKIVPLYAAGCRPIVGRLSAIS
jgi:hypothetical protein